MNDAALDVDLNLLRVLDALLETGSVREAAEQLHLSAPAVSRSLGRLRRALGDPLFVRAGRTLTPTPRALELRGPVREALEAAVAVLTPPSPTDPRLLRRRFRVRADDAVMTVMALPLLNRLQKAAPDVDVDFLPELRDHTQAFRDGKLDVVIGVQPDPGPDIMAATLLTDHFVAAVRDDHPLTRQALDVERYAAAAHITVSPRAARIGPIDHALAEHRLVRQRVRTVTSFVVAAHVVATTDHVGALPRALVQALGPTLKITGLPIPLDIPTFEIRQFWHARNDRDPAHRWFRDQVATVAADAASP